MGLRFAGLGLFGLGRTVCIIIISSSFLSASPNSVEAAELPSFDETAGSGSSLEREVWTSILASRDVALDCETAVDPRADTSHCLLNGAFLAQILSRPSLAQQIPAKGVRISGALIDGDLDLSHMTVNTHLAVVGSTIRGSLKLDGAILQKEVSFARTHLEGVTGDALAAKANLIFRNATIAGDAAFLTATIAGQFSLSGASIGGALDCSACMIDKGVFLRNTSVSGYVSFSYSKIKSAFVMSNAILGSNFDLSNSDVDTTIFADQGQVAGFFSLQNARISGNLSLAGTKVGSGLEFFSMNIGGFLDAQDAVIGGTVNAQNAQLEEVRLDRNSFSGDVDFGQAKIAGFFATSQRLGDGPGWASQFNRRLRLNGIEIGGGLSLTNATFNDVELLNANVKGTVVLQGMFATCSSGGRTTRQELVCKRRVRWRFQLYAMPCGRKHGLA